jgi:pyruvate/2-oxoglutarate/acetoin dehydrogenase E1 component
LISIKICKSIAKTNRLLVIDEDVPGGASAYILQQIRQQRPYNYLDSKRSTCKKHRPLMEQMEIISLNLL